MGGLAESGTVDVGNIYDIIFILSRTVAFKGFFQNVASPFFCTRPWRGPVSTV